jgi:tetratricopeptide (TPR) repeat protein
MKLIRFFDLGPCTPLLASLLVGATATLSGATALPRLTPPAKLLVPQDGGKTDKIIRRNPRTGRVSTINGMVLENGLGGVKVDRDGKESTYDSSEIVDIEWCVVPATFRDGKVFAARGDHENALARFKMAAGNADARPVVQGTARLNAAEALLAWGASDSNRYAECVTEVDRYLSDNPQARGVPKARWIKARASLLAGDAVTAAEGFRALYDSGVVQSAQGYSRTFCMDAGLEAAHAFLAGETANTGTARELFASLEVAFGQAATLEGVSAEERVHLLAGQGRAAVGEGFCLLAAGDANKAERFFQGRLSNASSNPAQRFSVLYGLGLSLLAQGKLIQGQVELAKVSSLDHTSRDRKAAALLAMADAALKLGAADAPTLAKRWLTTVTGVYADTPSAAKAARALENL